MPQNSNDKSRKTHRDSLSKISTRCIDKQESFDKQTSNAESHPPTDIKCILHTNEECMRVIENEPFNYDGQKEGSQLNTLEAPKHSPVPQFFHGIGSARPCLPPKRQLGGCFEHLPIDPFMFDHFNGPPLQGIADNMYMPNISRPPEVLMPIPGAG